MAVLTSLYNTCWMLACRREAWAFSQAIQNVRETQELELSQILRRNSHTWFGEKHAFPLIGNMRDFQRAVPLSTYEDYRTPLERIAAGEANVLTADTVQLLQPTGGSTSGQKLVPYTASLRRGFQRAIRAWIHDLFRYRSAVRRGRAYWSISPLACTRRKSIGGIPIGFDDDAQYLGTWEQLLVRRTLAVPTDVARCSTVAAAWYATLFFLLRAHDLSLISIWSPTFLAELLTSLASNWPRLCDDLECGRMSADSRDEYSPFPERQFAPMPRRARLLREAFDAGDNVRDWVRKIWPSLALVSCWTDGASAPHANALQQLVSDVEIQPKGLLATEAFVSIPRTLQPAPALAVRSHFFEFQPANDASSTEDDRRLLLSDELEVGEEYRVVVTTAGGLYRYQLQDQVAVVGFEAQAPLLKFVGRADATCDLVGEKLSAAHVQSVLQRAFTGLDLRPAFAVLASDTTSPPRYVLRLVEPALDDAALLAQLRTAVDEELSNHPGYRYAREIGQLAELRIERLNADRAAELMREHLADRIAAGQRAGDIKPYVIVPSSH
jgi:hypothetical protein